MDELSKYYEYLKGAGADVPGTLESFKNTLSDDNNGRQYYSYLKKGGYDAPDTYESFRGTLMPAAPVAEPVKKNESLPHGVSPVGDTFAAGGGGLSKTSESDNGTLETPVTPLTAGDAANNFGIPTTNIQQPAVGDNTATKNTLAGGFDDILHRNERLAAQQANTERILKSTPKAIENTVAKSMKLKGINALPGSAQFNEAAGEYTKAIANGDATVAFDHKTGEPGLIRTDGFATGWKKAWNATTKSSDDAQKFAWGMSDAERVAFLEQQEQGGEGDEYLSHRLNGWGELGAAGGGNAPLIGKAAAYGVLGSVAAAAVPETGALSLTALPVALPFIMTTGDLISQGATNEIIRRYRQLVKDYPNNDKAELMHKAGVGGALMGGLGGLATGAVLSGGVGAAIKKAPVQGLTAVSAEGKSVLGHFLGGAVKSSLKMGTASGLSTAVSEQEGRLEGVNISDQQLREDESKAFIDNATVGFVLHAVTAGAAGVLRLPKAVQSAIKYAVAQQNEGLLGSILKTNEQAGMIPSGMTERVMGDLKAYKQSLGKVPQGLNPQSEASVAGLILKRTKLEQEAKLPNVDVTSQEDYKAKMDHINFQIAEIKRTGKPLTVEIDEATGKPYKPPAYDDVNKARVEGLADKIAKGKPVEHPIDNYIEQSFPEQLHKELGRLAQIEGSEQKDKEKPKSDIRDNVAAYMKGKVPEPIEQPDFNAGDLVDKAGTYKGKQGMFTLDGKTLLFDVDGTNRRYEVGNIDKLKDTPVGELGITHEGTVVTMSDGGDIKVRNKLYKNNYSDPFAAINKDGDGNVVSVNLETADGKKRTFKGSIAEDIAYHINLKDITKNNESIKEFEEHLNEDETAQKQADNAGLSGNAEAGAVKDNAQLPAEEAGGGTGGGSGAVEGTNGTAVTEGDAHAAIDKTELTPELEKLGKIPAESAEDLAEKIKDDANTKAKLEEIIPGPQGKSGAESTGKPENTGTTEAGGREDAGAVAYASTHSFVDYKELHPDGSYEDYNELRYHGVDVPDNLLKELSKEHEDAHSTGSTTKEAAVEPDKSFDDKIDDIADKVIDILTPNSTKGAKKAGIGLPEIVKGAAAIIKAAYHAKENIRDAIEEAIKHIKSLIVIDANAENNIRMAFAHQADQLENKAHLRTINTMLTEGKTDEQAMMYLDRKGVPLYNAYAILGDAKSDLVTPEEKEQAIEDATKVYNTKVEDRWLGEKALTYIESRATALVQQEAIKKSAVRNGDLQQAAKDALAAPGTPKERTTNAQKLNNAFEASKDWRNVDRAIHIYLDLKRNPDHYNDYYDKLTPKQKAIVDLSQHLTPTQLKIADDIGKQYEELSKTAVDNDIIKEALDNYAARAWDFSTSAKREPPASGSFATNTKHSLARSLDTILQGQAEGLKLKTEGATNNLQQLKTELGNVIENRNLIDKGFSTKVDTGKVDEKGQPITQSFFTTDTQRPGYAKIDNPQFKKWSYAGKAGDGTMIMDRNTKVAGNTILMKKDIYAPASVTKSLNNILGKSVLNGKVPGIEAYTKFTRAIKQSILSFSGFHYAAFTRAHWLSGKMTELKALNPISAYRQGLQTFHAMTPEVKELIRDGAMTIGRQQDWQEGITGDEGGVKGLLNQFHRHLFETYGAGLKVFDGVNLYRHELIKNSKLANPLTRAEVAKKVGKLMNDTYGGENWQSMRGSVLQSPTARHIASLALLAPDWTISNIRLMKNAFSGDAGKLYRNMWFRVLARGAATTVAMNALMTLMDDKDDKGNPLPFWQAFENRYKKAWDAGHLRSLMVDMTPLYRKMPGSDKTQRAYFPIFGAYTDPLRMVNNIPDFLESKGNPTTIKLGLEIFTAENWQHKTFTDIDELLGIDDKGSYTKTQAAHKAGEISPYSHKPYKTDAAGFVKGANKGGKLGGELVKYDMKPHGGLSFSQYPSFALSQIRGAMPTAIQSIAQGAQGENDWAKSILQSAGTGVLFGKEGTQDNGTIATIVNKIKKLTAKK